MALEKILQKYRFYTGYTVPPIKRLKSGILAFDIVTGGGIPIGRFTGFHGDKSTGKSTMALRFINNFLKQDKRKAGYIDFENTYDPLWASKYISDLDRLYVYQPEYGELGIDFIIEICKYPEEIGLLVIDSIATIIPTKEADSDAFTQHVGIHPRLVNSMFRKLLPIISRNNQNNTNVTVILINQIRMKIDGFGMPNQITKPGGKMQEAIMSMDIRFYNKEYIKVQDIPIKSVMQVNVEKNKVGGHPKRTAQFNMYLVNYNGYSIGDIEDEETFLTYMKKLEVLKRTGNKWQLSDKEFKNLTEVSAFLKTNKEAKLKIADYIIDLIAEDTSILLKEEPNVA